MLRFWPITLLLNLLALGLAIAAALFWAETRGGTYALLVGVIVYLALGWNLAAAAIASGRVDANRYLKPLFLGCWLLVGVALAIGAATQFGLAPPLAFIVGAFGGLVGASFLIAPAVLAITDKPPEEAARR